MSPPMAGGGQMGNMMNIPPPPPRYPPGSATAPGVMIPPPPGPPPGSTMANQQTWHGNYGRMYDVRSNYNMPPPPPTGQHQPYNPKMHAQMAARQQNMVMPPPPPQSDAMSATYIPTEGTYGEGVGIPGFGGEETLKLRPEGMSEASMGGTMMDNASSREKLYLSAAAQVRGLSNASAMVAQNSIPPEMAAQWPLDTVLIWLAQNQFSKEWQETFRVLNLHGRQFLEVGSPHGPRGNSSTMHQLVYPQLASECMKHGGQWDQQAERDEGKRLRRLIRGIVTGRPVEQPKTAASHARKDSSNSGQGGTLPSAGTEPAEFIDVSTQLSRSPSVPRLYTRTIVIS